MNCTVSHGYSFFAKFQGVDPLLGAEMWSTAEVMGVLLNH
ncbi:hypothetical protein GARC_0245 [Paraglaciecola arctica BSs20135]|uniref:Uncharacterized protein n=1 Tax=Paraglaciecola arctica BSs20135 TaxID=493475 RepID=K6YGD7_9ALTE|nr:hypothetical protein GARC_0245 [Paraglaciecola arctica BSs20135]